MHVKILMKPILGRKCCKPNLPHSWLSFCSCVSLKFDAGSEVDSTNKADEDEFLLSTFKSPEQISDELVTLSLLPHSRWHSLLHLDVIKVLIHV
jgi:hypothetical protein